LHEYERRGYGYRCRDEARLGEVDRRRTPPNPETATPQRRRTVRRAVLVLSVYQSDARAVQLHVAPPGAVAAQYRRKRERFPLRLYNVAALTKARHEKPQKGNPHDLTINQHVLPVASIARFAGGDPIAT
jgi:hypothetical protein